MSTPHRLAGFSLVELLLVLIVLGMVLAMAVPGFQRYMNSQALEGATDMVRGQVQLARSKALATNQTQQVSFTRLSNGLVRMRSVGGGFVGSRTLPVGVSMPAQSDSVVDLDGDGHALVSRNLILADRRGRRDTLSIELSGLVYVH